MCIKSIRELGAAYVKVSRFTMTNNLISLLLAIVGIVVTSAFTCSRSKTIPLPHVLALMLQRIAF